MLVSDSYIVDGIEAFRLTIIIIIMMMMMMTMMMMIIITIF